MRPCSTTTTVLLLYIQLSGTSIDIKTLPPDLRRLGLDQVLGPPSSLRSTLPPDWTGDHEAVLDGDQGKVLLSWSIDGEYIHFKVISTVTAGAD